MTRKIICMCLLLPLAVALWPQAMGADQQQETWRWHLDHALSYLRAGMYADARDLLLRALELAAGEAEKAESLFWLAAACFGNHDERVFEFLKELFTLQPRRPLPAADLPAGFADLYGLLQATQAEPATAARETLADRRLAAIDRKIGRATTVRDLSGIVAYGTAVVGGLCALPLLASLFSKELGPEWVGAVLAYYGLPVLVVGVAAWAIHLRTKKNLRFWEAERQAISFSLVFRPEIRKYAVGVSVSF